MINPILTHIIFELRILTNFGLKAIKGEMFRNKNVTDKVIKCLSKTVPPRITLGVASRQVYTIERAWVMQVSVKVEVNS